MVKRTDELYYARTNNEKEKVKYKVLNFLILSFGHLNGNDLNYLINGRLVLGV